MSITSTKDSSLEGRSIAGEFNPCSLWTRPTDWLVLPDVTGLQKFVGLYAIYEDSNFIALSATTSAGTYTVNWGDGTIEAFVSNVTAYHQYDYTDADLNGTECSLGYKQAIVTITPTTNNLTGLNLNLKHTQVGLNSYVSGFLDIAVCGANLTILTFGGGTIKHSNLKQFSLGNNLVTSFLTFFQNCYSLESIPLLSTASGLNFSYMFGSCYSLKRLPLFDTASGTNFSYMFLYCYHLQTIPLLNTISGNNFSYMFQYCDSLQTIPLLNTVAGINFSYMFQYCYSLRYVPLLNTVTGNNFSYMFQSCFALVTIPLFNTVAGNNFSYMFNVCNSLQTVPLLNTGAGNNFSNMFNGCGALQTIPLLNTSAGTNFSFMFAYCYSLVTIPLLNTALGTNFSYMFYSAFSLQTIPAIVMSGALSTTDYGNLFTSCGQLSKISATGIKWTFTVASLKLSGTALNEIYTNLAVVTGRTITVTSNWGVATDDPTIATAKGWTVTG
jgi:hypothetical protein